MNVEHQWNGYGQEKLKYSYKNLPLFHFIHHIIHVYCYENYLNLSNKNHCLVNQ